MVRPAAGSERKAKNRTLAISVPVGETRVLKHFQERMPYGLFVPDVDMPLRLLRARAGPGGWKGASPR